MIYPRKNLLINFFFKNYIKFILHRNFREISFDPVTIDADQPVLLIANHFSWWDGFILYLLNERIIRKKFHIMILEETVRKVSFMKYMGAFSIKKSSRDVITSLNFAVSLLSNPQNLVLIYPQGRICSNFSSDIVLENGLSKILKQASSNVQIVFAVTFVENLKFKKPMANVYLKNMEGIYDTVAINTAYQQFYNAARERQAQITF